MATTAVMGCSGIVYRIRSNDFSKVISFTIPRIASHVKITPISGVTLTAVGFYGPQGRVLRLPLAMPGINDRITAFRYEGYKVTNYEMESAAITGLCNLLGHRATTICLIIANRINGDASADYHSYMNKLIRYTLEKLS